MPRPAMPIQPDAGAPVRGYDQSRHPMQADRALQVGPLQAAWGYVDRAKDRRRPGAIAHQWGQGWQAAQPEHMRGHGNITLG